MTLVQSSSSTSDPPEHSLKTNDQGVSRTSLEGQSLSTADSPMGARSIRSRLDYAQSPKGRLES